MNQCNLEIKDLYDVVNTVKLYNMKNCWKYMLQQGKLIYGSHFILTAQHRTTLYKLLIYAIEDPEGMTRLNLDPKKGILLMGEPESGKTAMMRLVKAFFPNKKQYDIKTCRVLSQDFSHKGFEVTSSLLAPNAKGILLDNLGKEQVAKHYGYTCDIVYNIVEHYYEQRHDLSYPKLHITTTLSPSEIEKKYGAGFRRMLIEMFNIITMT